MQFKLTLNAWAIFKLMIGGSVIVLDPYNDSIIKISKGDDTIMRKA